MPQVEANEIMLRQLDDVLSQLARLQASLAEKERRYMALSALPQDGPELAELSRQELHQSLNLDSAALDKIELLLRSVSVEHTEGDMDLP